MPYSQYSVRFMKKLIKKRAALEPESPIGQACIAKRVQDKMKKREAKRETKDRVIRRLRRVPVKRYYLGSKVKWYILKVEDARE